MTFTSPAAVADGLGERLGLRRPLVSVAPSRGVAMADMVNNAATPDIRIDPETFAIHVEGELVVPAPVDELPLAQR